MINIEKFLKENDVIKLDWDGVKMDMLVGDNLFWDTYETGEYNVMVEPLTDGGIIYLVTLIKPNVTMRAMVARDVLSRKGLI